MLRSLVVIATLAVMAMAAVPEHEVKYLPGWNGPLPSKQYSGYLNISASKHMHYIYVQAEVDAATAPLVIFLNGGPGCSSLYSYLDETGPLNIDPNDPSQLIRFNYTWAKQAHMLYFESPVGVGFSYSDNPADYEVDDDQTAHDNLAAVQLFFDLYPELNTKGRNFFITGESYAGIYVPTLAEAIVHAVQAGKYRGLPLTGIAVGNGCTGTEIGVCGGGNQADKYETEYLLGQAFAPMKLKDSIRKACDWDQEDVSDECKNLVAELHQAVGNINLYNIYGSCISGSAENNFAMENLPTPLNRKLGGPNACIDSIKESAYMNKAEVQEELHVVAPPYRWAVCGNQIQYASTRKNLPRDTYPLLIKNMRVLIFNGDWDACVPYTDNEAWTEGMNLPVDAPWHPWTYNNGQVGGYATRYAKNSFTFITIRGGRHEVPETAPDKAFEMLRRFIAGEQF